MWRGAPPRPQPLRHPPAAWQPPRPSLGAPVGGHSGTARDMGGQEGGAEGWKSGPLSPPHALLLSSPSPPPTPPAPPPSTPPAPLLSPPLFPDPLFPDPPFFTPPTSSSLKRTWEMMRCDTRPSAPTVTRRRSDSTGAKMRPPVGLRSCGETHHDCCRSTAHHTPARHGVWYPSFSHQHSPYHPASTPKVPLRPVPDQLPDPLTLMSSGRRDSGHMAPTCTLS